MSQRFDQITNRRAIIDRRALADTLREVAGGQPDRAKCRAAAVVVLGDALKAGRAELKRRLAEAPNRGVQYAVGHALLTDQLLRLIYEQQARPGA